MWHYGSDEFFMRRALELALRGAGSVSPNPMVGAVVVCNGRIIGEGWHHRYGEPHAEVNAIDSVRDKNLLPESTMYVTLEPCSHWGKTPPCCDLIIANSFKRVVVGCVDPYHKVHGNGISRMHDAGIETKVGILEKECIESNRRFFTSHTKSRPYVILKWAQTRDGFVDVERPAELPPAWMTGPECKRLVHRWRAEEDAIMVGRRTVEMDNPSLTVREVEGRNPLRITLDRNLVLKPSYNIFDTQARTILFTSVENKSAAQQKFEVNPTVDIEAIDYTHEVLPQVLFALSCRRVQSLFVEGGTMLLQSFIDADLWDEARIFVSPMESSELYTSIVGAKGVTSPQIDISGVKPTDIDGVQLFVVRNA